MCGLAGAHSGFLTEQEIYNVEVLGMLSSFRGRDSTGILTVSKTKKGRYMYDTYKQLGGAGYVLETEGVRKLFDKDVSTIAVHCRSATIGDINVQNAHPHRHEHIIATHNGTIPAFNDEMKALNLTSDSQVLTYKLATMPVEDALRDANKGAFALVYADTKRGTLHMVRNYERPLWYLSNKDKSTWYWASEREALEWMRDRSGRADFGIPELLRVNTLVTFHNGEVEPTVRDLRLYRIPEVWTNKEKEKEDDELLYANWAEQHPGWIKNGNHSIVERAKEARRNAAFRKNGWEKDRPVIHDLNDPLPSILLPPPEEKSNVIDLKADDVTPEKEEVKVHVPFGERLSIRQGNDVRITMYSGYQDSVMELQTAEQLLMNGCEFCSEPKDITDVVWWISSEHFLCDDCLHSNKFVEDYLLGANPYKGEVVQIDVNSLERVYAAVKDKGEYQA